VVVFVLAVLHSLESGTDGAGTWFRVMILDSAALVLGLVIDLRRFVPDPDRGL
jgi:hypothetical protein